MKSSVNATWDSLLESLANLQDEVSQSNNRDREPIAASLHTLSLALSGLSLAWQDIARQIPDEDAEVESSGFTPQRTYTRPLAAALLELGSATPTAAIQRVGEIMAGQLTDGDLGLLPKSRLVRWENNVRFARDMLCRRGLLCPPVRGVSSRWKLTPEGEKWARSADPLIPEFTDPNQGTFAL